MAGHSLGELKRHIPATAWLFGDIPAGGWRHVSFSRWHQEGATLSESTKNEDDSADS